MTRKIYPRWIENKPKERGSICYFVAGYGCIAIGESGNPLQRAHSTLINKKWAALFLWVNLHQFGIFDTATREHLEALIICSAANKRDQWGKEFCLTNRKYAQTLGNFSGKEFHHAHLIELLLSNFINYTRSHADPRGRFSTDCDTWFNENETDEARAAAYSRLCTNMHGPNRVSIPVRYIELRLSPYQED